MADANSKACRVCGLTFDLDGFHRNALNADGRHAECKACRCKIASERHHRTKTLKPLSPIAQCAHCGKDFERPQPKRPGDPPRHAKHCSIECRFWSKVDSSGGAESCWPWKGAKKAGGYGRFGIHGQTDQASRVAYELTSGPIPDGLFACHKCDNPPCCNPSHLFLGTHRDNMLDMQAKGRNVMTPEGRERVRASRLGKPRSPEVREKLRQASLGQKHSAEHTAKVVAAHLGRKNTDETKAKMRAAWELRKIKKAAGVYDR